MKNIKEIKELAKKLQTANHYICPDRFVNLCIIAGENNKDEIQKLYKVHRQGIFHFITVAPENILESFLNMLDMLELENKKRVYTYIDPDMFQKYFYKKDGKILEAEINHKNYIDLKTAVSIYEQADEIIAIRDHCDTIDLQTGKKINYYKGDIITATNDFDIKKHKLFIAVGKNKYQELLWTEKYGYLTPKGYENLDKSEFLTMKDILNTEEAVSYHAVNGYRKPVLLGNTCKDIHLLKPIKAKK